MPLGARDSEESNYVEEESERSSDDEESSSPVTKEDSKQREYYRRVDQTLKEYSNFSKPFVRRHDRSKLDNGLAQILKESVNGVKEEEAESVDTRYIVMRWFGYLLLTGLVGLWNNTWAEIASITQGGHHNTASIPVAIRTFIFVSGYAIAFKVAGTYIDIGVENIFLRFVADMTFGHCSPKKMSKEERKVFIRKYGYKPKGWYLPFVRTMQFLLYSGAYWAGAQAGTRLVRAWFKSSPNFTAVPDQDNLDQPSEWIPVIYGVFLFGKLMFPFLDYISTHCQEHFKYVLNKYSALLHSETLMARTMYHGYIQMHGTFSVWNDYSKGLMSGFIMYNYLFVWAFSYFTWSTGDLALDLAYAMVINKIDKWWYNIISTSVVLVVMFLIYAAYSWNHTQYMARLDEKILSKFANNPEVRKKFEVDTTTTVRSTSVVSNRGEGK
jgi:hypothetical protein